MKKLCMAIAVTGALIAPQLQGAMQVRLYQDTSAYSFGTGGEFRAVASPDLNSALYGLAGYVSGTSGVTINTLGTTYFQTFCIEHSESFSQGDTYNVAISDRARNGNQGVTGDPISIGTAYLYSQFAAGSLVGLDAFNTPVPYDYTYGAGRTASAGALQQTLWWLEGEVADPGNGNAFRNKVLNLYGVGATANSGGAFNVRALNLGAPGQFQDQLVVIPEPTTVIAGALLLLPFGVSTIRFIRKNRAA